MLRYSTADEPDWEEATIRLATLGLADRSREVRSFATELVTQARAGRLLGPLRDAIAKETSAETADFMRVQESVARQGHWLGEADELGLRSIEFQGLSGARDRCITAVPAIEVERLGEAEAARRVRMSLTDPNSEEAAWATAAHQEWRRGRGFID